MSSGLPSPACGRGAGGEGANCAGELIASSGLTASEARSLLACALQVAREALIARPEQPVAADAARRFTELRERRRRGEPIAYLLGEREFFGRRFRVDHKVLIPRPETECLVEAAMQALEPLTDARVVDLGTGSGCIAITLALERADARVCGTDNSEAALEVARGNAAELSARVEFLHGSWYAPLAGRFDLIVSNPPYVAAGDPHLVDLGFEPAGALTDGSDGLSCLRTIIEQASAHLAENGTLLVEHGFEQGAAVRAMMQASGLRSIVTRNDLAGLPRICGGRRG
jgi:release factor glutamine methyltransferase